MRLKLLSIVRKRKVLGPSFIGLLSKYFLANMMKKLIYILWASYYFRCSINLILTWNGTKC